MASNTVFCGSCFGEFDRAEWEADTRCPECESPKCAITKARAAALSPPQEPNDG